MRDYARIAPQFWIGATGKAIRKHGAEAQVIALYLVSNPHANMIGLYHLPIAYISADTGITFEGALKALASLSEARFCDYDEDSEVVWVFEMARFQVAAKLKPGDFQCKGVQNAYDNLPRNPFLSSFYDKYAANFHMTNNRGKQSPFEAPSKPLRSQEQEQEQEQENISEKDKSFSSLAVTGESEKISEKVLPCPHQEIIDLFAEHLPMLPQPKVWNGGREKALAARWRDCSRKVPGVSNGYTTKAEGLDYWARFFRFVAKSKQLTCGIKNSNGSVWIPDLPWLLKPENFAKVIEERYHEIAA